MLIFLTGSCTLRPHTKVYLVFDCTNPRFLTHVDLFLAIDSASFQGFATPSSVGRRQLSSRSNSGVPGRGPIGGPPSQAIHQSSPSSTLEPTPLGSIQLDGEMDAEASGDGSSDLLLKFGFAESFADSPERSSPRHPRQGAASDKERPHQQKQQQRRRQQPPSSATSQPVQLMWQHSEGPHMGHAAKCKRLQQMRILQAGIVSSTGDI